MRRAQAHGNEEKDVLDETPGFVRGTLFESAPTSFFEWVWSKLYVSRMKVAIF